MPSLRSRALVPLLILLALVSACGASGRQKTLRATLIGLNATRDAFVVWDAGHQSALVDKAASKDEAEAALITYRTKREPLVRRLELGYRALATAAVLENEGPSLQAALEAANLAAAAWLELRGGK